MIKLTKLAIALTAISSFTTVNANENITYGIQTSVGFGGDEIIENSTTSTITSGDSISFGGFINTPILFSDFYGKISASYAFENQSYINAEESFNRLPINFLLMRKSGDYSYGAGITYHLNPSYEITYTAGGKDIIDYDNALGLVLEATKAIGSFGLDVGVQYTNIEYSGDDNKSDSNSFSLNEKADGSNIAVTLIKTF